MTILWATVISLGLLILIHELGHFIIAKVSGVGVSVFSIGFGPKLLWKKIGETEYRLAAIPLGGFVKMIGEGEEDEVSKEEIQRSFKHKSVFIRFLIVAAGPLTNIFFAIFIFSMIFMIKGTPDLNTKIGEVNVGTPAFEANILENDQITAIDHEPIIYWKELSQIINQSDGKEMIFTIKRDNDEFDVRVVPSKMEIKNLFGETKIRWAIGILSAGEVIIESVNPFEAVLKGFEKTWEITSLTFISIYKIITGVISVDNLGGPIMIAKMAGDQAKQGTLNLILFIAFLSVNLGILNLLPIPILDGGHLVFFLIEAVRGKPLSSNQMELFQKIGMFLLLTLFVLVMYNDIINVFIGKN